MCIRDRRLAVHLMNGRLEPPFYRRPVLDVAEPESSQEELKAMADQLEAALILSLIHIFVRRCREALLEIKEDRRLDCVLKDWETSFPFFCRDFL